MDTDGVYYINWSGTHDEQGGLVFRWGGMGFTHLRSGLLAVLKLMKKHGDFDTISQRIKEKENVKSIDG